MSENQNLAVWNQVQTTNPKYTKEFTRAGGFRGTAINPTYLAMRATEVFGECGKGWGITVLDERYVDGAPIFEANKEQVFSGQYSESTDKEGVVTKSPVFTEKVTNIKIANEIIHVVRVSLWYKKDGETCSVEQYGQTSFVSKGKYGLQTDEEAPKKSITDAMSKCLSLLGFSADVHMGMYDSNKYVNDLKAAQEQKAKTVVPVAKPVAVVTPAPVVSPQAGAIELSKDGKDIIKRIDENSEKQSFIPQEMFNKFIEERITNEGEREHIRSYANEKKVLAVAKPTQ